MVNYRIKRHIRETRIAIRIGLIGAGRIGATFAYHLKNNDFDALVVASPTNTHPEIIQAAASAPKHIFCEKPLALTLEDCDTAIAAVDAAGEKLKLGFMRRFDAGYVGAKKDRRGSHR